MNVTMQIQENSSGVYVSDLGHTYGLRELDRIIRQLQTARAWLKADRKIRTPTK